jgi:hypothetical protein
MKRNILIVGLSCLLACGVLPTQVSTGRMEFTCTDGQKFSCVIQIDGRKVLHQYKCDGLVQTPPNKTQCVSTGKNHLIDQDRDWETIFPANITPPVRTWKSIPELYTDERGDVWGQGDWTFAW